MKSSISYLSSEEICVYVNLYTKHSISVVDVWRRVSNWTHIKPDTQDSDGSNSNFVLHQMTYLKQQRTRFYYEVAFVFSIIVIPMFVQAGFFEPVSYLFASNDTTEEQVGFEDTDADGVLGRVNSTTNLARGGGSVMVEDGVFVSAGAAGDDEIATSRLTNGEISVYTVRPGDSMSQIAEMYGVTTNTILWANDISRPTDIRPGDSLIILPIVGVQHTIQSGDSLSSIAKKYEGDEDEILVYNRIESSADLVVGERIVIPGGRIEAPSTPTRTASTPQPTRVSGSVSSSGGFVHPAPGTVRTQGIHGFNAVDYGGPIGTPILAAAAGEVIISRGSGWNGGYGNYVVIRHPNGVQTLYAHNNTNLVGVGEFVEAGQQIATMGNTGRSTGPHLHFEVRGARNPF